MNQLIGFVLGVLASLIAAGILSILSRPFRYWMRKQYRIWSFAVRRSIHSRNINLLGVWGERTLNLGIILNGSSSYIVDMEEAFVSEALHLLKRDGVLLHIERSLGSAGTTNKGNERAVKKLFSQFPNSRPDIVVTFGSGISTFVRQACPNTPQIFVGVTNPIASELCKTFEPDTSRGDVCGTTFSVSAKDRIDFLSKALPHRRIGFIYNPAYVADVHHLEDFRAEMAQLGASFHEICVSQPHISEADQKDVDVLVGWLYLHEHIADFLKCSIRPVVGGGWVDLRKGACCCICDDEREVGRLAASKVLYDYVMNSTPLCRIPIQRPSGNVKNRLLTGINLDAAARYGISFPENIVATSRYRIRENKVSK